MSHDMKKGAMEEEEHKMESAGGMRWLLTYADMITLLLGLFVIIAGTRSQDETKFQIIADQAERVFGGGSALLLEGEGVLEGSKGVLPFGTLAKKEGEEKKKEQAFTVTQTSVGILINLSSGILFDSGSAELKPDARAVIEEVYDLYLKKDSNSILIKGHTDIMPISSLIFPSNWELSAGRAASVARYLINRWGIEPTRITTAGCADTEPVASNDTEEGRSKNRRVEIFVLSNEASKVMGQIRNANQQPAAGTPVLIPEATGIAGEGSTQGDQMPKSTE